MIFFILVWLNFSAPVLVRARDARTEKNQEINLCKSLLLKFHIPSIIVLVGRRKTRNSLSTTRERVLYPKRLPERITK